MGVIDAIHKRRAVRKFSEVQVADEVIEKILYAVHYSQSSKNTQPWRFIVVRDREMLVALLKLGDFAWHLAGAAFAVVLVGTREGDWGAFDLGQAGAYLQLAADELGVGSCIAAIYKPEEAKEILGIPATHSAFCAISFGYPSPTNKPARLGGRRPLSDVVNWDRWQEEPVE